jgi:dTMP kinase
MPLGLTLLTSSIYALTEHEPISSPLARQFAALGVPRGELARTRGRLRPRRLVLDRFWWSTMAYGWYAHSEALGIAAPTF